MKPWEQLDRIEVPDGGGELSLHRRIGMGIGGTDEFEIRIDRQVLMSSRQFSSEERLAELGCEAFQNKPDARVLIGGLGMGFTLRTALDQLQPTAEVLVAELMPAVVAWNRGPLGPLANNPLDDPRTAVHEGDVRDQLRGAQDSFDAILLDIDNSPDALTHPDNSWLYGMKGLHAARKALRKGGVLAVWSCSDSQAFTRRLEQCGLAARTVKARARGNKGATHIIWLATPRSGPAPPPAQPAAPPRKRRRPRG